MGVLGVSPQKPKIFFKNQTQFCLNIESTNCCGYREYKVKVIKI